VPVDPILQGLVAGFLQEATELADQTTRSVLALEAARAGGVPLTQDYDRAARGLHTLKGSAATLGLDDVALLAHHMEDHVAPLRKALQPLPPGTADWLLRTLDALLSRVRAHAEQAGEGLPPVETLLTSPEERLLPNTPQSTLPRTDLTEGQAVQPTAGLSDALADWRVSTEQVVGLMREVERLREVRLRLDERRLELERASEHLAQLGMLAQTAEPRMRVLGTGRALRSDGEELADIVESLEDGIKAISTMPVHSVADSLHRAVRDLCRASGKEARLSIVGVELSLDRRILNALKPALTHLVRNAVDHGIEAPAERLRRGKHREGAIVIRVEQQGSIVSVEVADDGAGIDVSRVRELALRRGVLPQAELEAMDDGQVRQLVFRSGFSTADQVTALSGRGVGLDVVRSQVQGLNGNVEVQGVVGQGARFLLTMPTELGGFPVLVVRCGEHQLGLPLLCVEAIVRARAERIHVSAQGMSLEHDGKSIPLEDLGERLLLNQAETPGERRPLILTQFQGEWVAFTVDEIVGERELVVRSMPAELRGVDAYQGAAVLARGELLPVLRADWLVKKSTETRTFSSQRVLVVDDSLTARAIHRSILEAGGFSVHAVGSARRALEHLGQAAYAAVVADIAMAEMDGLELVRAARSQPGGARIPFVLVSANPELRTPALAAGADGFLSKADCAAGRLLAELTSVIERRKGDA
jgi:two-component system chemotaxis sensor kinase CheA